MKNENRPHHRLLSQLHKANLSLSSIPKDLASWQQFLSVVNRDHFAHTETRQALECSLEVSSRELKDETEQRLSAIQQSEDKMRFMANMSHEIRTPIHGILGSLDVVRSTQLDERQQQFIETAHVSCEAMLDIINNILDYSKISADKFELEMTQFSLHELMQEVNDIMSIMHPDKPVKVMSFVGPGIPQTVRGDCSRIRQMLINLIGNGLKFTEHGEVYTRVHKQAESATKITLRFEIRDTGIGIPKDMLESVFNCFVQVDASTCRRYGGTGLGLTIVKEFTQLMGGTAGVESVQGKGSLFWFEIVLDKVAQPIITSDRKSLSGLSVLVVDDVNANRQIFSEYLNSWGAEPTLASSGQEAIEKMIEGYDNGYPCNLVLLDWFMPNMDGLTVAKQIHNDPRINDIPIVLLSSYPIAQEKLDRAGVKYTLTKPIRSSVLRNMLIEVVDKNKKSISLPTSRSVQKTPTILLAEDHPVNALIAKTMLENEGFDIDHVEDGKEVVEAIKKHQYSIILMDINMPEVDGYAASKLIRQWEKQNEVKSIPIIAMTANALKGDREKCLQAGMNDYLPKPVRRDELLAKVNAWVNKSLCKDTEACEV